MFVRRPDELESLRPGQGPRAHAALRDLISPKVLRGPAVRGHHSTDDRHVEIGFLDGPKSLPQIQVRDDDDRCLVDLREIEGLGREGEAFFRVTRSQNRPRPVTLARPQSEVEISLFRLRRQSGGRSAPLHEDRDERRLRHAGLADCLDHEAETATGRGRHGANPGKARAHRHVHRGQLVLDLLDDDAVLRSVQGHPVQNRRRRGHRILREKLHAGGEGAEAEGLVPGHEVLRLVRVGEPQVKGSAHLDHGTRPELRGLEILLCDFRFLVAPDVLERTLHMPEVHVEQLNRSPQRDRVPHQRVRRERLGLLPQRDSDEPHVLPDLRRIRFHGVDVEDDRAVLGDVGLVDVHRLLVQAQDDVRVVPVRQEGIQAAADLSPDVTAADHTLIRGIRPGVKAASSADFGERFGG